MQGEDVFREYLARYFGDEVEKCCRDDEDEVMAREMGFGKVYSSIRRFGFGGASAIGNAESGKA
jgi:hypothetical protein